MCRYCWRLAARAIHHLTETGSNPRVETGSHPPSSPSPTAKTTMCLRWNRNLNLKRSTCCLEVFDFRAVLSPDPAPPPRANLMWLKRTDDPSDEGTFCRERASHPPFPERYCYTVCDVNNDAK